MGRVFDVIRSSDTRTVLTLNHSDKLASVNVIESSELVDCEWISEKLGEKVVRFVTTHEESNWAKHVRIKAYLDDGSARSIRLKLCLGDSYVRSEVDYLQDYVSLENAPLVPCYDACFVEGVGYHLLLDDLADTHSDRKVVEPTLAHGLALAEALGRMHSHHWESSEPPKNTKLDGYFVAVWSGVSHIEKATGREFSVRVADHEQAMRLRWSDPKGMTLLHGDLNPTNVLTPIGQDSPVYFLDRQPLGDSLTYGLAVSDLAYALAPWWTYEFRKQHEIEILEQWYKSLGVTSYAFEQALLDWQLSVEQCLHVPIRWCSEPDGPEKMRWLWAWQLGNITGELLA